MKFSNVQWMLRIAACCVFLGRAWQFLRWDAPVRTLLWSQDSMEWVITGWFGIAWQDWVSSASVDQGIQLFVKAMGCVFLVCAGLVMAINAQRRWMVFPIALGVLQMLFLNYLLWMGMAWQIGMVIEHALQCIAPVLAVWAVLKPDQKYALYAMALVAIALTFVGHGLYAAGIHPTPGHFVTMLMSILNLSEGAARQILVIAGYLDFVVAAALFVPKLRQGALMYCAIWGGLTALARVVGYFDANQVLVWMDAWGYQTLYRVVHGLVPFALWYAMNQPRPAQSDSAYPALKPKEA